MKFVGIYSNNWPVLFVEFRYFLPISTIKNYIVIDFVPNKYLGRPEREIMLKKLTTNLPLPILALETSRLG